MEELSIEQKAKAYDELIEKLRDFYRDYDTISHLIDVKEELANLFPELRESEDERIRKRIIALINAHGQGMCKDEMLTWLEKQGKKPVEEYNITGITSGYAKGKLAKIIKDIESEDKIEALRTEYEKGRADAIAEMQVAWSEEDEKMLGYALDMIEWYSGKNEDKSRLVSNWLKSLKDRYTWKPSVEQLKVCKEVYADLLCVKGFDIGTVNSELNRLEEQLKTRSYGSKHTIR